MRVLLRLALKGSTVFKTLGVQRNVVRRLNARVTKAEVIEMEALESRIVR